MTMVEVRKDTNSTMIDSVTVDVAPGNAQVIKIKQPKTVILDKPNYHAWHVQFIANFKGNQFIEYIERIVPLDDPVFIQ